MGTWRAVSHSVLMIASVIATISHEAGQKSLLSELSCDGTPFRCLVRCLVARGPREPRRRRRAAFVHVMEVRNFSLAACWKEALPDVCEPRPDRLTPAPTGGFSPRELFMSVPAHYALLGLVIALSNGLATAALSYVSQPVKVRK